MPFLPGVYAEADMQTLGSYFSDDANTLVVDGWTLFGASIGFSVPIAGNKFTITGQARVANLADIMYMASGWVNPNVTPGGIPYIESGTPRGFTGRLGLEFRP